MVFKTWFLIHSPLQSQVFRLQMAPQSDRENVIANQFKGDATPCLLTRLKNIKQINLLLLVKGRFVVLRLHLFKWGKFHKVTAFISIWFWSDARAKPAMCQNPSEGRDRVGFSIPDSISRDGREDSGHVSVWLWSLLQTRCHRGD